MVKSVVERPIERRSNREREREREREKKSKSWKQNYVM